MEALGQSHAHPNQRTLLAQERKRRGCKAPVANTRDSWVTLAHRRGDTRTRRCKCTFFALGVTGRPLAPQRFYPLLFEPLAVLGTLVQRIDGRATRKRPPGSGRTPEATAGPTKRHRPFGAVLKKSATRRRVRESIAGQLRLLARVATAKGVTQPQRLVPPDCLCRASGVGGRRCRVLRRDGARLGGALGSRKWGAPGPSARGGGRRSSSGCAPLRRGKNGRRAATSARRRQWRPRRSPTERSKPPATCCARSVPVCHRPPHRRRSAWRSFRPPSPQQRDGFL
jgi:hypothetical protein